jgi:hypothetical protein
LRGTRARSTAAAVVSRPCRDLERNRRVVALDERLDRLGADAALALGLEL